MNPDALWRAALHDLNNAFGGLQGILDLNPDPARPLRERDRQRMEAVVAEGLHLVALARGLLLGREEAPQMVEPQAFQELLDTRLGSLTALHRCPVVSRVEGGLYPVGLVAFAASVTRQILPLAAPGPLSLWALSDVAGVRFTWSLVEGLPESLQADEARPRDLPAYHALHCLETRGGELVWEAGELRASFPSS